MLSSIDNSLRIYEYRSLELKREIKGGDEYYGIVELSNNQIAVG